MAARQSSHDKRALTVREWLVVNAVFALSFGGMRSGYNGLSLLATWWTCLMVLAFILLYVPRGLDRALIALLIASCLLVLWMS